MARRTLALAFLASIAAASVAAQRLDVRIAPFARFDELGWNIADSDGDPDVLSELTWTDLRIVGLEAEAAGVLSRAIEGRARARVGWILRGDNQDSDFLYDDREGEYSRSDNDASEGAVWELSAALGYRLGRGSRLSALPLLGVEVAQQRLGMSDGYQTISLPPSGVALGPFPGLDSSYVATWWGPWVGAEGLLATRGGSTARLAASYHLLGYYAWADWNLRTDFEHPKSFDHRSWGQAFRAEAACEIPVSLDARFCLRAEATLAMAAAGTDRTFWIGGAVGETRLNEVWWRSFAASVGMRFNVGGRPGGARELRAVDRSRP